MAEPSVRLCGNKIAVFSDIHSNYYALQTRILYDAIAKASGFTFTLEEYDENGKARFTFTK